MALTLIFYQCTLEFGNNENRKDAESQEYVACSNNGIEFNLKQNVSLTWLIACRHHVLKASHAASLVQKWDIKVYCLSCSSHCIFAPSKSKKHESSRFAALITNGDLLWSAEKVEDVVTISVLLEQLVLLHHHTAGFFCEKVKNRSWREAWLRSTQLFIGTDSSCELK